MPVFNNILAGSSGQGDTGYDIDQSLRFNDDDSASLLWTPSGNGNRRTWTVSFWTKRGHISDISYIFTANSYNNFCGFGSSDQIQILAGNGSVFDIQSTQKFRDPSAWYHMVYVLDTTESTDSNRVKCWANGSEVTLADTGGGAWPTLNQELDFNTTVAFGVGGNTTYNYDGYLAEFHFIDGTALTPASFGETNSATNQWVPVEYSGSYGTNGFYLKFGGEGFLTYDRESEIAVTSSFTWLFTSSGNTDGEDLVNGLVTNNDAGGGWMPSGDVTDRWIKFDFGSGKVYKACQWITINSTGSEGTWKWQGSNNDSDWTDIGGTFTLGGSSSGSNVTYTLGDTLNGNTASYRYYRILGTTGSANTNGRRLAMYFSETVYGLGGDSSGQGNNFSENNLSWSDQVIDTPTLNYCTLNPLFKYSSDTASWSEGNLKHTASGASEFTTGTFSVNSGKWYYEMAGITNAQTTIGAWKEEGLTYTTTTFTSLWNYRYYGSNGIVYDDNGTTVQTYNTYTPGDVIGCALDMDNGAIYFSKNGVWQGSSNPATGSNPAATTNLTDGKAWVPAGTVDSSQSAVFNFGQDSSFAGNETAQGNGGDGEDFYYTPPTGYKALNTDNLDDPAIALPEDHFNSILWTGDATSPRSFTGVGFTPDLVWTKNRTTGVSHMLYDTVRGAGSTKSLESNASLAEGGGNQATYGYLSAFGSDGFTTTDGSGSPNYYFNENTKNFVAWNWKAGGTASSNGDGSITSSVSANPTAGFSIGTYTGNGTAGATVGHGLSQAPELIIVKCYDGLTFNWTVGWGAGGAAWTDYMHLDTTAAAVDDLDFWRDTYPTSSVFTIGSNGNVNYNNDDFVFYAFNSVDGYSKVGSFTGNGSADGPFAYTGFQPAFIMLKGTIATVHWHMFDSARYTYNETDNGVNGGIAANLTSMTTGQGAGPIDILSNGFKIRNANGNDNNNGTTFIYLAFAESPFKTSNAR